MEDAKPLLLNVNRKVFAFGGVDSPVNRNEVLKFTNINADARMKLPDTNANHDRGACIRLDSDRVLLVSHTGTQSSEIYSQVSNTTGGSLGRMLNCSCST